MTELSQELRDAGVELVAGRPPKPIETPVPPPPPPPPKPPMMPPMPEDK